MRIKQDAKCSSCSEEDSHLHKFLYCCRVQGSIQWITKFIENVCSIRINDIQNFIMLDFPYINRKMVNTLSIIICNYLACIWFNRENMDFLEKKLKAKILKERNFLRYILGEKFKQTFCNRYNEIDFNQMNNM